MGDWSDSRKKVEAGLARRYRKNRLLHFGGLLATFFGVAFLLVFFASVGLKGASAFQQSYASLDIEFSRDDLAPAGELDLEFADFDAVVRKALQEQFPDVKDRRARRDLNRLISVGAAYELRDLLEAHPEYLGTRRTVWLPVTADVDMVVKGSIDRDLDEAQRQVNDRQLAWIDFLLAEERIEKRFNTALFSNGDSREPELAGIKGALMGTFYMLVVTIVLAFPIGAAAAVYLEEFAPRNRWSDLIEVNINNLAAVPSIVFGLLGLAVFINWLSLPRSAPLVGGLVLALLTLPVIIIAARAAIKSVPPSIREAALGLGASRMQVVTHHVLPLAMPGMLTGAIIGMSRALGESAPLLMIGMIAFIVDVPAGFTDPATALPVQIYLWADSPERAFAERTSAAIIVLLGFLLVMNLTAVIMRKRVERQW
ncbi:phosphate ABC transporter permease PstA [Woeseia oceani]|uniref:Phosphate transport system permease protein PstA n=1 Tax=Woeseia oceani TaxID=1548547 RepID=A0A193LEX1_9GAMM|nr:phosphate ABC transporter permease PstA [Woeseia oceani]ANO51075.1 phosphate ABC transporter, permease protein PstA [Woeseia oceani]